MCTAATAPRPQPSTHPLTAQAPKAAAAGAASRPSLLARPQPGAAAGGRQAPGSSRPGAAGSGAEGGSSSLKAVPLPERRAGWAKMGVVALRDLGLEAVPPECFEGLGDAVRGADLSQVGLLRRGMGVLGGMRRSQPRECVCRPCGRVVFKVQAMACAAMRTAAVAITTP